MTLIRINNSKGDSMKRKFDNISKLLIVGNGFDLAHGLKTTYKDFVEKYQNNKIITSYLKFTTNFEKDIENNKLFFEVESWYDFENVIEEVCNFYWRKLFDAYTNNYNENKKPAIEQEYYEFEKIYNNLVGFFKEYIRNINNKVIINEEITLIDSIISVIDSKTFIYNFNYTSTAELYINNINYLHGSIKNDDEIIMGMTNDAISDITHEDFILNKKVNLRERLKFIRFLKSKKEYSEEEIYYKVEKFIPEIVSLDSGRGGYTFDNEPRDDVDKDILEYSKINKGLEYQINDNYETIKEIYIIGHGLKSDKYVISSIIERCVNLKRVYLFCYAGELESSIKEKINFLNRFIDLNKIESMYY